jgi:hypothetical protein
MESELSSQMLPVLLEYVECGQLDSILGEIGNNLTSTLILSGWETKKNPANCQLPLTFRNNSIPLDTLGVIAKGDRKMGWEWYGEFFRQLFKYRGLKQFFLNRFHIISHLEAEVLIGPPCSYSSSGSSFYVPSLYQKGFIDIFKGVLLLTDRS